MFLSKTFITLFAAAFVAASESTTCYFIMTPSPDNGVASLQPSINYAVGHEVGVEYPNVVFHDDNTLVRHDDGTYDVTSIISVDGVNGADVAAYVNTWKGKTLEGLQAEWAVGAVNCS